MNGLLNTGCVLVGNCDVPYNWNEERDLGSWVTAYQREGREPAEVLQRIRALFNVEWESPTDNLIDLTGKE